MAETLMSEEIKPIRSQRDHARALDEIECLWDVEPGTPAHDRLEVLATLVDDYETKQWPIDPPDPIDVIEYVMAEWGLTRADLAPLIGSRGRVSEIINRRRRLTMEMAWRLHRAFGIPADLLLKPYELMR
jgi:HTH-type transcriptional regulator / antitoxin HigA